MSIKKTVEQLQQQLDHYINAMARSNRQVERVAITQAQMNALNIYHQNSHLKPNFYRGVELYVDETNQRQTR